ncbi:MAG: hypothetical protein WCJ69_09185 [Betaproteobacteria bacterium]|jgi:hypothetical protein
MHSNRLEFPIHGKRRFRREAPDPASAMTLRSHRMQAGHLRLGSRGTGAEDDEIVWPGIPMA